MKIIQSILTVVVLISIVYLLATREKNKSEIEKWLDVNRPAVEKILEGSGVEVAVSQDKSLVFIGGEVTDEDRNNLINRVIEELGPPPIGK